MITMNIYTQKHILILNWVYTNKMPDNYWPTTTTKNNNKNKHTNKQTSKQKQTDNNILFRNPITYHLSRA